MRSGVVPFVVPISRLLGYAAAAYVPAQSPLIDLAVPGITSASDSVKPSFESPEHASIGDAVKLKLPAGTIDGSHFNYTLQGQSLSFGQVIAFAGDFFYRWSYGSCQPSISGAWDERPIDGADKALHHVQFFKEASASVLSCVIAAVGRQEKDLHEGMLHGQDPAQIYKRRSFTDNKDFTYCTLGYVAIALCNWDHFGEDAGKAYAGTHLAALEKAWQAGESRNVTQLREAYFVEGYAQHFLTDMFSAGHIRTPRRTLHTPRFTTSFFPGDQCSKLQHDEDSANGLWVSNSLGQSWAVYGDKQLLQGRSAKNLQQAIAASQAGLDEIWEAFNGIVAHPDDFRALQIAPIPETALEPSNFVPLFYVVNQTNVLFRNNTAGRAVETGRRTLITPAQDSVWQESKAIYEASGPFKNQFPYTRSFASESVFLHLQPLRQGNDTILCSVYGNVDPGQVGTSWGMRSLASAVISGAGVSSWMDAQLLDDGIIALVSGAGDDQRVHHLAMRLNEGDDGQASLDIVWNSLADADETLSASPKRILYGSFCDGSDISTMVKYVECAETEQSALEAWIIDEIGDRAPVRLEPTWDVTAFTIIATHHISFSDTHTTIVGYSHDNDTKTGVLTFIHWTDNYDELVVFALTMDQLRQTQTFLSDAFSGRIVTISNSSSTTSEQIRVESLFLQHGEDDSGVELLAMYGQNFKASWGATHFNDYLLWFLEDLRGNGHVDLIGYISTKNNTELTVVVFPGFANGSFGNPVVSPIVLNATVGTLLNDDFMKPFVTQQADYTYHDGNVTSAAIISLFDNYGVIGARLVAPTFHGSLNYEIKGQNAAMAGQRASFLKPVSSTLEHASMNKVVGLIQL